jgi:hypothetical protein
MQNLEVVGVRVHLRRHGPDIVAIITKMDDPASPGNPLEMDFRVPRGAGLKYAKDNWPKLKLTITREPGA